MLGVEHQLARDIEITKNLNGLFIGMFSEEEINAFNRLVDRGLARRKYVGAAGLIGLAKADIDKDL